MDSAFRRQCPQSEIAQRVSHLQIGSALLFGPLVGTYGGCRVLHSDLPGI